MRKVSMLVMLSASSVAASGTKEEIEKKWNSLFNLKVFERFKVLKATFEATFDALDPKGKQESGETATWFASLSDEPEYQAWCEQEKPAERVVKLRNIVRTWYYLARADGSRSVHAAQVLAMISTPQKFANIQRMEHEDRFWTLVAVYTPFVKQIVSDWCATWGAEPPKFPLSVQDLNKIHLNPALAMIEGPSYKVHCVKDSTIEYVVTRWRLGYPDQPSHFVGDDYCCLARPVDPFLDSISTNLKAQQKVLRVIYASQQSLE